jgi:hypothetical protein
MKPTTAANRFGRGNVARAISFDFEGRPDLPGVGALAVSGADAQACFERAMVRANEIL